MQDSLQTELSARPEAASPAKETVPVTKAPAKAREISLDSIPAPAPADTFVANETYPRPDTAAIAGWDVWASAAGIKTLPDAPPAPPAWTLGLEPVPRPASAASSDGLMSIIVVLLITIALSFKQCRRLMPLMFKELLSVRNRTKTFDTHTAGETQLMVLFGAQVSVYLGIMLNVGADWFSGRPVLANSFLTTAVLIGLAATYYVFQIVAYDTVGYAFSTPNGRRQWLRGFNASQALLGFALAIPTLVTVFYPSAAPVTLVCAAVFYFLARIVFIAKGFRIFYHNFGSSLYFILYLCSLEIIPLIFIYNIAISLNFNAPF